MQSDPEKLAELADAILDDSAIGLSDLMTALRSRCLDLSAQCRESHRGIPAEDWRLRAAVLERAAKELAAIDAA